MLATLSHSEPLPVKVHQIFFWTWLYKKLESFFVTSSRSQLLALIAMLFLLILTLAYWNKKERGTSNLQPIIA